MVRLVAIQTNFSSGELDPLLRARVELEQYKNGAETLTNVLVQPQGGVRRRGGLKHLMEIPSAASPQNGTRSVAFEFSVDDSYMLIFVNQRMYVFKDRTLITNINGSGNPYLAVTAVTSSILSTMCWTQSADTLIITHKDINPIKIVRGGTDATWTVSNISFIGIPKYAFTIAYSNPAGTLTPSATSGAITLTASSAVFSAGSVGQYVNATPQGRARIVAYTSTTVVSAVTEIPFFNTSAIATGSWEYESGYEDVWSSTKGWPRTCTFHEGRLYFGGSKSRPSTVWGSKVAQFFDFNPDQVYDDDAIEATLDTNSLNTITDIISGRDLQVFTTGGEFYVPQSGLDPILAQRLRVMRDVIEMPSTGSVFRVLSADASRAEGLNPSTVVFDEVHVQPDDRLWNTMNLGSGTRKQPLIVGITTAGSRTDSRGQDTVCFKLWQYGMRLKAGEIADPSFFFRWHGAPDGADHLDPKVWAEANPAFGDFLHPSDFESAVLSIP